MIENIHRPAPTHVTLAVVLQVRDGRLQSLLWERARDPFAGRWSLPGGYLGERETLERSIRRHLAVKVDVRELVGTAEIAERLRLADPRTVHSWRRRYKDFPKPIANLRHALVWAWSDVERWARRTGRL